MTQGVLIYTHTSSEKVSNFAFRRFHSSLLSLQHFGYYFLLLNQECSDNPVIICWIKLVLVLNEICIVKRLTSPGHSCDTDILHMHGILSFASMTSFSSHELWLAGFLSGWSYTYHTSESSFASSCIDIQDVHQAFSH